MAAHGVLWWHRVADDRHRQTRFLKPFDDGEIGWIAILSFIDHDLSKASRKSSAYDFWSGLFAPAGTPPAVIARLNAEVRKALESPEVKERLSALGTDIAPTTPADFDKKVARELVENAELVKKAGIKVQ